jgi:hypothetical protein
MRLSIASCSFAALLLLSASGVAQSVNCRPRICSWGHDFESQVTNTPSGTDFTQVSGGGTHSLALRIVDCNGNGIPDYQDIANTTSQDCNGNSVPDECDIFAGTSLDLDSNDIPDECQGVWTDLGFGLVGTAGIPLMTGTGALLEGTPASLSLAQAKPLSPAPLVIGLSAINAPFKGGTLVPMPDFILPLFSDFSGGASLSTTWPAGVPSGFSTYFQWWVQDAVGPSGYAASNAVAATAP